MHISFKAHSSDVSSSSSNLIEYLDKENQINNLSSEYIGYENFFNSEFNTQNTTQDIKKSDIIELLDSNRGSQKLTSSNFFLLNVSPSKFELKHMEKIAEKELEKRGILENNNELSKVYYKEQKDELMKIQLKFYTKDLMNKYAENFQREIYVNENKLPNEIQKKELNDLTNKVFSDYLKDNGIQLNLSNESNLDKSKEWISVNNLKVVEDKGNSFLVEIDLKDKGKANVFVPKKLLQEKEKGIYRLPKNLYEAKEKEVVSKNTLKEIDYKFSKVVNSTRNDENKFLTFEKKDSRFSEPLLLSFNDKDVVKKDNKYFVSEHLFNEKENNSLKVGIEKDFGGDREKIYNALGESKGFDFSKRPLNGEDLMWFAKIETTRKYGRTDKFVKENQIVIKEINKLKKENKSEKEIKKLENQLHKEKISGKIIVSGMLKEGLQYHSHVVVSRHDKTMVNPRNKISLSPLANAKESKMLNGSKVGFNRDEFFKASEKLFDEKFEYERPLKESYQKLNNVKNHNKLQNTVRNEGKKYLEKVTGVREIKKELGLSNPVVNHLSNQALSQLKQDLGLQQKITDPKKLDELKSKNVSNLGHSVVDSIKQQVGLSEIPTRFPTSFTQLALKGVKKIITKGFEY